MEFASLVLLLAITVCSTRELTRQVLYDAFKPGRNITGKIGAEFRSASNVECSIRCSSDVDCVFYQYKKSIQNNCHLITTAAADDVQIFVPDKSSESYKARIDLPEPIVYRSFDTLNGLTLMEGDTVGNFSALVPGKINMAVQTDHTQQRWVNLVDLSAACITRLDTCGPEGAAAAFWVKLIHFSRAGLELTDRSDFRTFFQAVGGSWIHMVLNYIGPENGQGIGMYYNGMKQDGDSTKSSYSGNNYTPSDGTVIVGRRYNYYSSVAIDELLFFNVKLTDGQIRELYNQGFIL